MKLEDLADYINHWSSVYKVVEKDSLGIERDVWESQGEDHFVHATVYFRLALERMGGGTTIKKWENFPKGNINIAPNLH